MTGPEIQTEIALIGIELERLGKRLYKLSIAMGRRRGKRGPVRSKTMTPEMADRARSLYSTGKMNQMQIATLLGVNTGRVSEAVRGKRT